MVEDSNLSFSGGDCIGHLTHLAAASERGWVRPLGAAKDLGDRPHTCTAGEFAEFGGTLGGLGLAVHEAHQHRTITAAVTL